MQELPYEQELLIGSNYYKLCDLLRKYSAIGMPRTAPRIRDIVVEYAAPKAPKVGIRIQFKLIFTPHI